jgi:hypothetical protein
MTRTNPEPQPRGHKDSGSSYSPPVRVASKPQSMTKVQPQIDEKARQRSEDKGKGVIHPSDPEAKIQYVSPESVVLSQGEREVGVKKDLLPPLFGELRDWADQLKANSD